MDWQTAFNIVAGIVGALGGWVLNMVWSSVRRNERDIALFKESVAETYVRRDDFKDAIQAIFTKLDRIEDKIDAKVDKP